MLLDRLSARMKWTGAAGVLAALLLMPRAGAATPEADYIAARDRAIADLEAKRQAKTPDDILNAAEDQALAALKPRLIAILGETPPPGFSAPPAMRPDGLQNGVGSGSLDGLSFSDPGAAGSVLVSTPGLLRPWLVAHRSWWPDRPPMPSDIDAALQRGDFYTQAIDSDAAVSVFGSVPVDVPAGASKAVAVLVEQSQVLATKPPDRLIVSVFKGDRVLIALVRAEAKPLAIAACETLWKAYLRRRHQAETFDAGIKIEAEGETAYQGCYRRRVRTAPFLPKLAAQATRLASQLAAYGEGNKTSPAAK